MTSHPPPSTSTLPPSQLPMETLLNVLQPITVPTSSPKASFTNWGLSYTCKPTVVFEPETEEQCELIVELARREGQSVRATGVGHSPSDLACTSGYMLRTEKLSKVIEVSTTRHPPRLEEEQSCFRGFYSHPNVPLSLIFPSRQSPSDCCARFSVRHGFVSPSYLIHLTLDTI